MNNGLIPLVQIFGPKKEGFFFCIIHFLFCIILVDKKQIGGKISLSLFFNGGIRGLWKNERYRAILRVCLNDISHDERSRVHGADNIVSFSLLSWQSGGAGFIRWRTRWGSGGLKSKTRWELQRDHLDRKKLVTIGRCQVARMANNRLWAIWIDEKAPPTSGMNACDPASYQDMKVTPQISKSASLKTPCKVQLFLAWSRTWDRSTWCH